MDMMKKIIPVLLVMLLSIQCKSQAPPAFDGDKAFDEEIFEPTVETMILSASANRN